MSTIEKDELLDKVLEGLNIPVEEITQHDLNTCHDQVISLYRRFKSEQTKLLDSLIEQLPEKIGPHMLAEGEKINRREYAQFANAYNQGIEDATKILLSAKDNLNGGRNDVG